MVEVAILTLGIQEAEGNDCEARDQDQDTWDKEQGAGKAAYEPSINIVLPIYFILQKNSYIFHPSKNIILQGY